MVKIIKKTLSQLQLKEQINSVILGKFNGDFRHRVKLNKCSRSSQLKAGFFLPPGQSLAWQKRKNRICPGGQLCGDYKEMIASISSSRSVPSRYWVSSIGRVGYSAGQHVTCNCFCESFSISADRDSCYWLECTIVTQVPV